MKKAKVIVGMGYPDFEEKLNEWLSMNKEVEIHHLSHAETHMTLTNGAGESLAVNSFSALIVYETLEKNKTGKITSRLPHISDIPPNVLKGML